MVQFLLDVHGQHLTAEGEAFGLLNHLLIGRHGVVPHHHVALKRQREVRSRRVAPRVRAVATVARNTKVNLRKSRLPKSTERHLCQRVRPVWLELNIYYH